MKLKSLVPKVQLQTAISGPCQCSAVLGGPATSTEDLRHQGALNKPGVLKHLWVL